MTALVRFCRYELRTTDTSAAQAFYADVFGFQVEGAPGAAISPLPERAAARGAPAHWLGHLGVQDVEGTAARIVARGGERLGPPPSAGGAERVVLRDPFGTIVAVCSNQDATSSGAVVWQDLHTRDHARAWALYAELFGWRATETLDLGPELGAYQMFSWDEAGPSVGGMVSSARMPHIHPHWLFHFHVEDLDEALAKVRSRGGKGVDPMRLPNGDRIAACEDAQGAAFALRSSVTRGL